MQPVLSEAKAIAIIRLPQYKSNVFSDEPVDYKSLAKAHDAVKPIILVDELTELEKLTAAAIDNTTDEVDLLSIMQAVNNHEVPLTKSHRKSLLCKKTKSV